MIVTSPPEIRRAPAGWARPHRGSWLPHLLAIVLLAGLPFATSPGDIISDSKFELAVNPAGFLREAFTLWNTQQFGQIQDQVAGYLFPMGPFFELLKLVKVDGWIVQRLWLGVVFVTAYAGAVTLARRLGIGGPLTRVLGGLVYALSPMALGMAGELSAELLPAVLLPWILLPLVGSPSGSPSESEAPRWRAVARSAFAVALCGGVNGSSTAAVVLPAFIYLLMTRRRLLGWWLVAVAVATAWWTIPLLLQSRYGVSILPYTESADTTTATTSLADAFRGTSDWLAYLNVSGQLWWPLAYQIATGFLPTLATGVLAALGLTGLLRRDMPLRKFWIVSVLAGVVIITAGHVSSFGNPLAQPVDALINGPASAVRNLWKFDPMIRLPVALGLAQLASGLGAARRVRAVLAGVLASLAVLLVPAFTTGLAADGAFAAIPSGWTTAANWLTAHAGRQAVLVVPGASFGQYMWGSPQDDVLQPLTNVDFAERDLSVIGSAGNERLLDAIDQRLAAGDGSSGLTQVLARMGVRYVVVRNDLVRQDLDGAWPARVNDALDSSPGLKLAATFGSSYGTYSPDDAATNFDSPYPEVEIYSVAGASPVATVQPVAGTIRVYGAPEAELTLADEGLLGERPVLMDNDGAGIAATPVVTDSLRRQVRNFGELRTSYSPTLTASQPLTTFEATADYTEPGWDAYQAVASYSGIKDVTASSSAADITAITGQWASGEYPFDALTGTKGTWESGSWTGPMGQWLQVDLVSNTDVGSIQAAFADNAAIGPAVTSVTVSTAAGSVTDPVAATGAVQTLTLPRGRTTWIRITVAGTAALPGPELGSQVAISSLAIPGVSASRAIVAPQVTGSVAVLAKDQPQPSGCMLTSLRWVCSPDLETSIEEQYGFDHEFTSASAGRAALRGSAILTDSAMVQQLTRLRASEAVITASSSYTSDPQDQAASAFDGDPQTAWVASPGDPDPTLRVNWTKPVTVSRLTISRPPGTASAYLRVLIVGSDGQARGATVPASGVVTFAPMRVTGLTLEFTSTQAPLQISDVAIPGVPFHGTPAGTFRLPCGLGPYLTVDGKVVRTSVTGTFSALETSRPVTFTACSAVKLRAAENSVVEPASDAFSVQDVVVSTAALPKATAPVAAGIVAWSSSSRQLRVSAAAESYLVVNENYNAGWQAKYDGSVLRPVQLDGWKQAWVLPAGTNGLVTLTYQPQKLYQDGIVGGLAGLAVIALLAAWPGLPRRWRRSRRIPVPDSAGPALIVAAAPVPWFTLGIASLALGLWLGGYPGLVVFPAAVLLFLIPTRLSRGRVLTGLLLTATISAAAGEYLRLSGDTGGPTTMLWDTIPQLCCLIIVARLMISLVRDP